MEERGPRLPACGARPRGHKQLARPWVPFDGDSERGRHGRVEFQHRPQERAPHGRVSLALLPPLPQGQHPGGTVRMLREGPRERSPDPGIVVVAQAADDAGLGRELPPRASRLGYPDLVAARGDRPEHAEHLQGLDPGRCQPRQERDHVRGSLPDHPSGDHVLLQFSQRVRLACDHAAQEARDRLALHLRPGDFVEARKSPADAHRFSRRGSVGMHTPASRLKRGQCRPLEAVTPTVRHTWIMAGGQHVLLTAQR